MDHNNSSPLDRFPDLPSQSKAPRVQENSVNRGYGGDGRSDPVPAAFLFQATRDDCDEIPVASVKYLLSHSNFTVGYFGMNFVVSRWCACSLKKSTKNHATVRVHTFHVHPQPRFTGIGILLHDPLQFELCDELDN